MNLSGVAIVLLELLEAEGLLEEGKKPCMRSERNTGPSRPRTRKLRQSSLVSSPTLAP